MSSAQQLRRRRPSPAEAAAGPGPGHVDDTAGAMRRAERRVLLGMLGVCSVVLLPTLFAREHGLPSVTPSWREFWLLRLLLNLLGYATVLGPVFLLVHYLRRVGYERRSGNSALARFLRLCAFGHSGGSGECQDPENGVQTGASGVRPPAGFFNPPNGSPGQHVLLVFCFAGLQFSYLTWGVLQERIMTRDYDGERFRDSHFLVFTNRALAGLVAGVALAMSPRPTARPVPVYQYAYSSLSNILSSWFQYEALKFVSFPTQVLAKASKIIPVMLMGKIVTRRSYEAYEYVTAAMISAGVAIFLLSSSSAHHPTVVTTFSGILLLTGYMMFDAFTSNWQDALFKRYHMSPLQMMVGANLWSCLLTFTSLVEQGSMGGALAFVGNHWRFATDLFFLSCCSAVGQLFIFFTIARFGAVTFIIIMTMRQAFAILLSCLIYAHPVTLVGVGGILIVFLALFLRIYCKWEHQRKPAAVPLTSVTSADGEQGAR